MCHIESVSGAARIIPFQKGGGATVTVFISYSSADEPTARAVASELEQAGLPTFLASRDIQPGHSYSSVIPGALRSAESVVLLLSEQATGSRHVQSEIDMAMSGGIPVLPVRLPGAPDPMLVESWAYLLRHSQIAHWQGAPALVQWVKQLGSGVRASRPHNRRRNRLILAATSVAVVAILAVGAVLVVRGLNSGTGTAGAEGAARVGETTSTPTGTGSVTTDPASGPLVVSAAYAMQRGCYGTTSLAMPAGAGALDSFHGTTDNDVRTQLLNAGAGAWLHGALELTLSASAGAAIAVQSVDTHVVRTLPAPLWIEAPIADFGGPYAPSRSFTFALDVPTLIDAGLTNVGASPDTAAGKYDNINLPGNRNLGADFQLAGTTQGSIQIESLACSGNYQWSVDLAYTVAGDARPHKVMLGPYKKYGVAEGTTSYSGFPQSDGTFKVQSQRQLNGNACEPEQGSVRGVSLKIPSSHQPVQFSDYVGGGNTAAQWNHLATSLILAADGTGALNSGLARDYNTATLSTAPQSNGTVLATVIDSGGLGLNTGQTFVISLLKGANGPVVTAPDPRDPSKTLYLCQTNAWDQRCAEDASDAGSPSAAPSK